MSIPAVGPALPSLNTSSLPAAQQTVQAEQNAQIAINNAATNMGAQGSSLSPNSSAAANITASLQSAQNTNLVSTSKTASTTNAPNQNQITQLLPNTPTTNTRTDSSFSASSTQPGMGNATASNTNSNGDMARILQSFSQSTVGNSTLSTNTSSGQAQLILPGQRGTFYTANTSANHFNNPNPGSVSTTSGGSNANPNNTEITTGSMLASRNTPTVTPQSNATTGAQTLTGAATLRAEGNINNQNATSPTSTSSPSSSSAFADPTAAARPEAASVRQAQTQTQIIAAATQQGIAEAKSAVAQSNQTSNPRTQPAGPDASMVAGAAIPMTSQDPGPKQGQIGLTPNGDPTVMSQTAAASGFGTRLQQRLNINLGLPGFTPANMTSAVGVLIISLIMLRVFFNGIPEEDLVGLSFATIVGIGLVVFPWVTKQKY